MARILDSQFPQIYTLTTDPDDVRRRGFRWNRVWGCFASSSMLTARNELDSVDLNRFIKKIDKWNTLTTKSRIEPDFRHRLRKYQIAGCQRLIRSRALILGDDMGLGKTIQTAVSLSAIKKSAVVICPNHLVKNWGKELNEWTWGMEIKLFTSIGQNTKWTMRDRTIHVLPYSQAHKLDFVKCHTLVLDESHFVNTTNTRRSQAIEKIQSDRRWFLSGTPYKNHPVELWNQFVLLGVKDFFGATKSGFELGFGLSDLIRGDDKRESGSSFNKSRIKRKHTIPTHLKPKTELNADDIALLKWALKPFYLRREKTHHLKLPPKQRVFHTFCDAVRGDSNIVKQFADIDVGEVKKIAHVSSVAELRVKSTLKMVRSKDFDAYLMNVAREPIILFAYHNEIIDELRQKLSHMKIPFKTIIKGDSPAQIDECVNWFQQCGRGVALVSIKKGSTGLTMTNAKRVVFVELDWTIAELDQCESRVHRFGKSTTTFIDYVIPNGGIENLVLNKLQQKENHNKIIHEGDEL
jgi:SWI/SNF-related matrix-associated actin-dependent regulator 1 of chromatin subfamily A